ncbi:MAG: UDP-N-acetylmuramoyl-tripeptide--D-alanyl-D-alanine ligase [Oscillospiraceae bacterium]|nr:UDP-N-acetylmuramoyl-tripeptide--D-alanyl-D-alanine ligase [Oscillospiraceae bacterium]
MKNLPIKTIIEQIDGKVLHGAKALVVTNVVTKIRNIRNGSLIFDIYIDSGKNLFSSAKCPPCVVVTDKPESFDMLAENVTVVQVSDLEIAYWKFINFYRSLFNIPIIGVTGTCGKTTTKEMIVRILSADYNVDSTYKSLNASFRHFGYLLDMNDNSQVGVFEMGVAAPGDLKGCCRYFKPQIGVITNIGIDHLQAFDSIDSYIKAKGEFVEGLDYKGILILNADDANIEKIDLSKYKGKIIYFGFSEKSNYKISNFVHVKHGLQFTMQHEDETVEFFIHDHAEFNVYNAAAAITATHVLGIAFEQSKDRLASFQNVEKHFEFNKGINDSIIIDDTWSTNPTSTEMALKLLKKLSIERKTIAALGKMSLLGDQSPKYHKQIGKLVASLGIDELIIIGNGANDIGLGALQNGMNQDNIHFCKDSDETCEVLKRVLDDNSIALIKTSMMASYDDLINKIIIK